METRYKWQQKGGNMRAENAERDERGRFGVGVSQEAYEPTELDQEQCEPAQLGCGGSEPAHIGGSGGGNSNDNLKRWEMHIATAMEDIPWLEMIAMQTKLPVIKRNAEIVAHFKRHVIVQGNEEDIISVKDAKRYFANYTRIGTPMHKRLVEELNRNTQKLAQADVYRYEDRNPQTGQRSYFGITIPPGTPPRPNENAVLINGVWSVDN